MKNTSESMRIFFLNGSENARKNKKTGVTKSIVEYKALNILRKSKDTLILILEHQIEIILSFMAFKMPSPFHK